jgi:hypothetical protein
MSSDIKPNAVHAVVTMQIALHSQNPDEIADGLNEFLRPSVGEGWVADYAFYNTDKPLLITASNNPVEGELFVTPSGTLYPDMDKSAEELSLEHFEVDNLDDVCQSNIDGVDHMVASVAENLALDDNLASAIDLLDNSHKNIATMLRALADSSLIRSYIQSNTN